MSQESCLKKMLSYSFQCFPNFLLLNLMKRDITLPSNFIATTIQNLSKLNAKFVTSKIIRDSINFPRLLLKMN